MLVSKISKRENRSCNDAAAQLLKPISPQNIEAQLVRH